LHELKSLLGSAPELLGQIGLALRIWETDSQQKFHYLFIRNELLKLNSVVKHECVASVLKSISDVPISLDRMSVNAGVRIDILSSDQVNFSIGGKVEPCAFFLQSRNYSFMRKRLNSVMQSHIWESLHKVSVLLPNHSLIEDKQGRSVLLDQSFVVMIQLNIFFEFR
jgi:hypothetical protein